MPHLIVEYTPAMCTELSQRIVEMERDSDVKEVL